MTDLDGLKASGTAREPGLLQYDRRLKQRPFDGKSNDALVVDFSRRFIRVD